MTAGMTYTPHQARLLMQGQMKLDLNTLPPEEVQALLIEETRLVNIEKLHGFNPLRSNIDGSKPALHRVEYKMCADHQVQGLATSLSRGLDTQCLVTKPLNTQFTFCDTKTLQVLDMRPSDWSFSEERAFFSRGCETFIVIPRQKTFYDLVLVTSVASRDKPGVPLDISVKVNGFEVVNFAEQFGKDAGRAAVRIFQLLCQSYDDTRSALRSHLRILEKAHEQLFIINDRIKA